jgi:hypothetical protein
LASLFAAPDMEGTSFPPVRKVQFYAAPPEFESKLGHGFAPKIIFILN